jgi:uncharacterized protein (TIGR02271 family)
MTTGSTTTGRSTLVGVFRDRSEAERAVQALHDAGFRDDQIGFAARDAQTTDTRVAHTDHGSNAASGAVTGGVLGALIGAGAALLIPGIGPVVAGGILASTLGGAAIGAAAGGLIGALTDLGVPEEEARYYDSELRAGRYIVTVKAADRYQDAYGILNRYGAYDYSNRGATTTAATASTATATNQGEIRVPEVEERLSVVKRPVQAGEVHLTKEVHEEQKSVPVNLTREEVHVEKRDVAERPLREGEKAFEEGTIRVPVHAEEAVARKEAVVTGEVVVNKTRETETEHVADTLRRTEVHVDRDRQEVAAPGGAAMYRTWATEMRDDARYRGRRFDEIEGDLQKDWTQRNPGTPWDTARSYVREAWTDVKSGV